MKKHVGSSFDELLLAFGNSSPSSGFANRQPVILKP